MNSVKTRNKKPVKDYGMKSLKNYLILLESFKTKSDAISWLGHNYIDGAYVERGSALKSI